jgi:hypothetical protein
MYGDHRDVWARAAVPETGPAASFQRRLALAPAQLFKIIRTAAGRRPGQNARWKVRLSEP